MPNKKQQIYKTESQLKEEAVAKQIADSEAEAKLNKSEFQKKRENFWYHYKLHTIASIVGIFLLVFFIKDMFFRTQPDATIIAVSSGHVSSETLESLTNALQERATDLNGDGKIVITADYIALPRLSDEDGEVPFTPDLTGGQQDMGYAMKLMAIITAASDPIYLLDEASYNYIASVGQGEDPTPDYSIFESFNVPASALTLGSTEAFELDGMTFYLRINCGDESYYEYCKQLLEAIAGE